MSFRPQKLSVDGREIRTSSHVRRASSGGVPSAALSNINEGNENETPIGRKISRPPMELKSNLPIHHSLIHLSRSIYLEIIGRILLKPLSK